LAPSFMELRKEVLLDWVKVAHRASVHKLGFG
jgi:hypothetical protein